MQGCCAVAFAILYLDRILIYDDYNVLAAALDTFKITLSPNSKVAGIISKKILLFTARTNVKTGFSFSGAKHEY